MKKCALIAVLFGILSCGNSKDDPQPNSTEVIYEVSTNAGTPFDYVGYADLDATSATGLIEWKVTGTGTFEKHAHIKKGGGAILQAQHATSNKWVLRIKSATGSVLAENATITLNPGTPSSYTATCQVIIP
ncbi:hypothetical protein SAMN05444266_101651 [Chitinophaga jiangningensis]|uniref:Uncharacterized protein n=1 Tax=Chitinophaga jiangningensis TaxID=1419482 RepID=A0A1M6WJ93_9BACT|nr:hypothetical protein [Chitinophaga jiangningensis]SHK93863.1 hypothetical protein SAMN05444266_101651 [Chitinophaga jiangningensis]